MQHLERHDRNLEVDPLWYTQPMKNCESVGDVVIAAKPKHQTSRSVEDRLEQCIHSQSTKMRKDTAT